MPLIGRVGVNALLIHAKMLASDHISASSFHAPLRFAMRVENARYAPHHVCLTWPVRSIPFDPARRHPDSPVQLRREETVLSDTNPQMPITIYTTAICPYCVSAKNFLKSKGFGWTEVRIDTDAAERERMMARAKRTSVPQIFVGDVHVGGFDDMMALHRAGKFEPLVAGDGA